MHGRNGITPNRTLSPPVSSKERNADLSGKAARCLTQLLTEKLVKGYYGKVTIEVSIQDGVINNFQDQAIRQHK